MTRVRVPDQCLGLDVKGGKSYDARGGIVDLDADDVSKISGSYAGDLGLIISAVTFRDPNGRDCKKCGRGLFGFQRKCPKCGTGVRA